MMVRVLDTAELPITREDDIVLVRRRVRALAGQLELDTFATAAVTTATSELARNVWTHGGGGRAVLEAVTDERRKGIRVSFIDDGPGISDLDRVMAGGYSTARSLGLGLSGSRRLVDAFDIRSRPGEGTTVTILKWARY